MGPRPVEDQLVGGADGRAPAGRRRLGWVVAALVAGTVLVVARPELALHGSPVEPPGPVPTRGVDPAPLRDGIRTVTWEERGDLSGDRAYVSASVRRIRQDSPNVARILFAGTLPDGSRLTLSGTDVSDDGVATVVHAMLAAPGIAPQDASVAEVTALTNPQQVLGWAAPGVDGRTYGVVLARPGPVLLEVSPSVRFRPDGTATRRWNPVRSRDGTAVVDLGERVDPVVAVRASGLGVYPVVTVVRVAAPDGALPPRSVAVGGVDDPSYAGPAQPLLLQGLRQGLEGLVDLDTADLRVLWSGAPWRARRLALVLATRPDGVRLRALVGQAGSLVFPAGVRALPTGAPDTAPWLLEPFTSQDPTFLLCPTGAAVVVRRPGGGPVRLAVPDDGAVAVYEPAAGPPSLRGARVRVLDGLDRELLDVVLPVAGLDDPLALDD